MSRHCRPQGLTPAPYRRAQVTHLPGSRDPFSVDTALIEWGLRGRRSLLPRTRRQKFARTARRYRAIDIQAAPHNHQRRRPLPNDLRHAIETIARTR
jgi:hypothetical protein